MLRRKIDFFGDHQIRIFDYKMFSMTIMIGSMSALCLAYTLNRSCIAYYQNSQTAWAEEANPSVPDANPATVSSNQQPQEFVVKYPDGSQKIVNIPNQSREAKIREGIMFRHNAARQEI